MGNICRSPSAQAVFQCWLKSKGLERDFMIDSAGTHNNHIGAKPDARSIRAALKRNIDMNHLRARQVQLNDWDQFDWLVVMDENNRATLQGMFPHRAQDQVLSMMRFAKTGTFTEVPDPYYGQADDFELVLDLLEQSCEGLYQFLTE